MSLGLVTGLDYGKDVVLLYPKRPMTDDRWPKAWLTPFTGVTVKMLQQQCGSNRMG
ncbi:hypothetical protein [Salinimonas sediminis]|uniref:hypothetical protein n=1 Tax=Salinimonas sediminis TaxID=2303538 RepID=UPI001473AA9F|nr:hypothetical protein [Salinimonas sediminis]